MAGVEYSTFRRLCVTTASRKSRSRMRFDSALLLPQIGSLSFNLLKLFPSFLYFFLLQHITLFKLHFKVLYSLLMSYTKDWAPMMDLNAKTVYRPKFLLPSEKKEELSRM